MSIKFKTIHIDDLPVYTYGWGSIDDVNRYAAMPRETQPAIIVDAAGDIVDGQRRVGASRLRGDTDVEAWVEC